jgi:glutathione S-transferase
MSHDLVLYTHPYSRASTVHWMLEEIGVPYRSEVHQFGPALKTPAYLAINPMGKVPALVHGETVVTEVAAICAYLADAFPEAGLAPAVSQRGAYYRWLFFAAGPLEAAISNHGAGWDPTGAQQVQFGYGSYERAVETLTTALAGRRYIAGDTFSTADLYIGSFVRWGMQFGGLDKRPEFVAYWDGLKDRPARLRCEARLAELAKQLA